jgi:hypothetical protein
MTAENWLSGINAQIEVNGLEEAAKKVYQEADKVLRANRRPASALKNEKVKEVHLWSHQTVFVLGYHKYVSIGIEHFDGCEDVYLDDAYVSVKDALTIGLLPYELARRVTATQYAWIGAEDKCKAEAALVKAAKAVGYTRAAELLEGKSGA